MFEKEVICVKNRFQEQSNLVNIMFFYIQIVTASVHQIFL